ncbi:MAG: polyisoprenyl-phosphate glycosyltransferase [Thermoleophilaceae bacterium]|nr:polyisoprenyl-phosphate glycosyltransferase [Thermoleophilaceae bacterium]
MGLVSVVAPMFDEEETVEAFYDRVRRALDGVRFELILVDDASRDKTPALLDRLADSDPRVKVLHLSRNFGHQAAITAGLEHASGDAVVMLDGDLQDPPEVIPEMLARWRDGADVVYGVRESRAGESRFKLVTASWFYRVFARLTKLDLRENSGDFRLLDRRALTAVLTMRERNRFLRGMTVWVGYVQTAVPYSRDARHAGETKYTLRKMVRFSLDAVASFSSFPLQIATFLGFLFSAIAFVSLPLVVLARVLSIYDAGIPSLLFVVLMLGGIQLITVGIIGEYVGRIYDEVKARPLYLVGEAKNLHAEPAGGTPSEPQRVPAP